MADAYQTGYLDGQEAEQQRIIEIFETNFDHAQAGDCSYFSCCMCETIAEIKEGK